METDELKTTILGKDEEQLKKIVLNIEKDKERLLQTIDECQQRITNIQEQERLIQQEVKNRTIKLDRMLNRNVVVVNIEYQIFDEKEWYIVTFAKPYFVIHEESLIWWFPKYMFLDLLNLLYNEPVIDSR